MSESAPNLVESTSAPRQEPTRTPVHAAIELVSGDLRRVETELGHLLESTIAIIPQVGGHLAFAGGKRFRPLVSLLAAKAAGFEDESRVTIAAVGELLHTATLLHDDVIDSGEFRRGRPATRLEYGNGMAVLTGDFCLARGLQAAAGIGDLRAVQTMADAVTRMAEGEVAQLHVAGEWALDRERYYMVIDRKTAALIAWCSSVAGLVAPEYRGPLERYGSEIGCAFQIADDVIDYTVDIGNSGKARGQDLRDGKLTLPAILACEDDPNLRAELRRLLERGPPTDHDAVMRIVERVSESSAIERSRATALEHARSAIEQLAVLPASPARDALKAVADYVARRNA
jgi:octaprenyl-diphosphate synthase